jgi:hypothetical protein
MFYTTIGSALEKLEVQFSLPDEKHLNSSKRNIVSNSINDFFSLICSTVEHNVLGDIETKKRLVETIT